MHACMIHKEICSRDYQLYYEIHYLEYLHWIFLVFKIVRLRLTEFRIYWQLERLSCIIERQGHRSMPPLGGTPPPGLLLPPSLDLDMGIYARHFSEKTVMNHCGDVMSSLSSRLPSFTATGMSDTCEQVDFPGGIFIMDQDKTLALDFAMTAADQLGKLCRRNEPLWRRRKEGFGGSDILDMDEYLRAFQWPVDLKQLQGGGEFRVEATRDSALVIMNSITLVNAFMDVVSLLSSPLVDYLYLSRIFLLSGRTNGWRCFLLSSRAPRPSK